MPVLQLTEKEWPKNGEELLDELIWGYGARATNWTVKDRSLTVSRPDCRQRVFALVYAARSHNEP